jgi:hypothetical protein
VHIFVALQIDFEIRSVLYLPHRMETFPSVFPGITAQVKTGREVASELFIKTQEITCIIQKHDKN